MRQTRVLSFLPLSLKLHREIVFSLWKGKSLYRSMMNYSLSSYSMTGAVVDLGSGTSRSSYYSYLSFLDASAVDRTDFYKDGEHVVKADLRKPLDLKKTYDGALLFNVLEHLPDPSFTLGSIAEILVDKGMLLGSVPYLHRYHADPHDYYRLSHEALSILLSSAGFGEIELIYLGFGPLIAGFHQWYELLPLFFRPLFCLPLLWLDLLICHFSDYHRQKYPLGYVFSARKMARQK